MRREGVKSKSDVDLINLDVRKYIEKSGRFIYKDCQTAEIANTYGAFFKNRRHSDIRDYIWR